jgi:hypothetical protein
MAQLGLAVLCKIFMRNFWSIIWWSQVVALAAVWVAAGALEVLLKPHKP